MYGLAKKKACWACTFLVAGDWAGHLRQRSHSGRVPGSHTELVLCPGSQPTGHVWGRGRGHGSSAHAQPARPAGLTPLQHVAGDGGATVVLWGRPRHHGTLVVHVEDLHAAGTGRRTCAAYRPLQYKLTALSSQCTAPKLCARKSSRVRFVCIVHMFLRI